MAYVYTCRSIPCVRSGDWQLEKDTMLIMSAMKKMQFSRRIGTLIDKPGEQLIELPLAISDNEGQKSYT